tara:strand:- start:193 stop:480 length:288 start_codon:yes stop_codon:yes gene_type:complete
VTLLHEYIQKQQWKDRPQYHRRNYNVEDPVRPAVICVMKEREEVAVVCHVKIFTLQLLLLDLQEQQVGCVCIIFNPTEDRRYRFETYRGYIDYPV